MGEFTGASAAGRSGKAALFASAREQGNHRGVRFFRLFSLPLFAGLLMSASDSAQPDAEAIAAYARGEAELAGRLWEQAAEKLGEHAPVRVQLNAASAALQRGAVKRAHELTLAARAKATGQEQARVDFLLAQVGYERARFAQRILSGPEAGPADVDRALGFASVAVEFWQRAAVAETSWGPARRNAERALRLLRALEIKQQEILGEVKLLSTPQARLRKPSAPKPGAPSPKPGKGKEQVLKTQPKSVAAVLQRLREREAERRARVEAARKRRGRGVRDW